MSTPTRLVHLATLATLILASQGCDTEPTDSGSGIPDLQFRHNHDGPGKLNTNFLGTHGEYPLDNLPLKDGAEASVRVLEIRASVCQGAAGGKIAGEFSTASLGLPDIQLSADGVLGPLTVADVNNPAFTCTVSDWHWGDTFWEIAVEVEVDGILETIETDLWLRDMKIDAFGSRAYEWLVNYPRVDPDYEGEILYRPTCDEDNDPFADPALAFHSYLVKDLTVDTQTGWFSHTNDTMYIACTRGAVGKAVSYGYTPWDFGTNFHQLATAMVRADYCGDGTSHTEVGTQIWLNDYVLYNNAPAPFPAVKEAEWTMALGGASCVSTPRLGELQGQPIVCGGNTLPACGGTGLPQPTIITFIPDPAP